MRSGLCGTARAIFSATVVAFTATFAGCVSISRDATPRLSASPPPQILERVYVGRNIPGGGYVSDADWTQFLADTVTPRFPAGYTVLGDEGRWRDRTGRIAREPGFIIEIVHPDSPETNRAVREIAEEYQRRFRQEAVLRVREHVEASF